jgi:AraC-like DNA-binding protein
LNQVRVVEAKRRLAEGAAPAEAAFACGFCDQSHMARQFKRTACVTPGGYKSAYVGPSERIASIPAPAPTPIV